MPENVSSICQLPQAEYKTYKKRKKFIPMGKYETSK